MEKKLITKANNDNSNSKWSEEITEKRQLQ